MQFISDSKRVGAHRNLMQSSVIQDSLNMALLEYQHRLTSNMSDANAAAAVSFKIKGALEFIDILIKLGEAAPRVDVSKIEKLDYRA